MHQSLPIYSGGLGALAGDLLKQASDRALPLVAVGLMYRQGYFRQRLEVTGWQQEYWVDVDPERLPAALVRAADGRPPMISLPRSRCSNWRSLRRRAERRWRRHSRPLASGRCSPRTRRSPPATRPIPAGT
jgi:glucan phosphorylase